MSTRKCVYITGGSSGIGLGLAQHYAKSGDDLVLLARDQKKLDAAVDVCKQCSSDPGQKIVAVSVDITAYAQLSATMPAVIAEHGTPDLVILSAGIAGNKTFLETSASEFDSMLDINVAGSRELARTVLPAMLERGSGQIAFVSSMAGLIGLYGYTAYSASKFAVTGLAQALRQELAGTGVSINLVCPPEVDTPMIAAESAAAVPQTRFLKDLIGTMAPEVVAAKIARGLRRNKSVIVPGVRASLMVFTARHFPELFARSSALLLRWKFG